MVTCPKCKKEDTYDITYIMYNDFVGDSVISTCKAQCLNCGTEFKVKEFYRWYHSKNMD